jgi:threonine/homoserine/homoserine lactone efflux protein
VFAALGCTAGILPHLLATVLGLAAVMHTSAVAFQALKYAGVAYLLSAVFMAMTFAVFVAYGILAHAFRRVVVESPRVQAWVRRGFAAIFAGLGVNLALTER